jgi:perosamine synthetase
MCPEMTQKMHSDPIHMAGPWITDLERDAVMDAVTNGWYERAYEYVEKFEREFAAYHGRKYALMTPNCTTSIHLLLTGLGIKDGDEVLAPECTWIATVAPVVYLRAKPVFCDIEQTSWCIDPKSIEQNITSRTKAIISVGLFGNMPNMDAIRDIAETKGLFWLEDAAESLGSTYRGVRSGKFGIASVFSFHRTKTLTTGEGGMLLLDDEDLFRRCKFLRDHGRVEGKAYYNSEVTYKYMPFNIQAALGYAQFKRLPELIEKKRWIFRQYQERLRDIPDLQLNEEPAHVQNSYWIPALVFGSSYKLSKQDAIQKLNDLGLPARPFFYPLSSLPAFPGLQENQRKNPTAYSISGHGINLPGAMTITESQIERMCDGMRKILEK